MSEMRASSGSHRALSCLRGVVRGGRILRGHGGEAAKLAVPPPLTSDVPAVRCDGVTQVVVPPPSPSTGGGCP
jgi:hypothetical protein